MKRNVKMKILIAVVFAILILALIAGFFMNRRGDGEVRSAYDYARKTTVSATKKAEKTTFGTRSILPAPSACEIMAPPAEEIAWETMPITLSSLRAMPVTATAVTPYVLTKELTKSMEPVIAADWMTIGIPRARSRPITEG